MAETDVSLFMRLHLGDWLRATQGMSAEEVGVHICLLTAAWQSGGRLPDDCDRLARLSRLHLDRFSTVFRCIEHLWPVVDGCRNAPGMVEQIEKARAAKLAAIARGKAGGVAPHPTQRKPISRVQVEMKSSSSRDEGRDGIDTPTSDLRLNPDLTPPSSASVSVPSLPLLASGSGEEQQPCQIEQKDSEKIRAVFAHYRTHHPRSFPSPVSTSKEWRHVQARLREGHGVDDLCRAIDGFHKSPWHLGENDRGREYLSLDLIMRDGSHVADGIAFFEAPDKPVMNEREMRSQRAGKGFLERLEALGMGDKPDGPGKI